MHQSHTTTNNGQYLDRKSIPEALLVSKKERYEHVGNRVNEIVNKCRNAQTPPHVAAREIANFLVDYSQVAGSERSMAVLSENFYSLGQYVAFITTSLKINLLPEEECVWLGQVRGYPWDAEGENFQFSDLFSSSPAIADCTGSEKLRLYRSYLMGKCAGFTKSLTQGEYFPKN